ncbi:pyridoxal-phosphate dependent enzyme [Nocardia acidivorans]|uniref:pyridoxal-phosphate dependent enzyme n=1 Tax=Nocardia acidivorans TaxID=404580 RepID=UPI000832357A|nr:pyridoxal-phosphate dependent enzyme [Nocardia acidivorans]
MSTVSATGADTYDSFAAAIGKYALVRLNRVTDDLRVTVYVKLEYLNPGGSVETRIAEFSAEQRLEHSWVDRVLARLGSAAALQGRHRLREQLGARGFLLR